MPCPVGKSLWGSASSAEKPRTRREQGLAYEGRTVEDACPYGGRGTPSHKPKRREVKRLPYNRRGILPPRRKLSAYKKGEPPFSTPITFRRARPCSRRLPPSASKGINDKHKMCIQSSCTIVYNLALDRGRLSLREGEALRFYCLREKSRRSPRSVP